MREAILFLARTVLDLCLLIFLLRLMLQLVRADFYNPLAQFVVRASNPLVVPARRIIPSIAGFDTATLVVLVLLELGVTAILLALIGQPFNWVLILQFGLLRLISLVLWFYFVSLLIYVILSWVAQRGPNPMGSILASINAPLLRPLRRIIPPIAGLDLSPLIAILLIQAIRIALPLPGVLA
jgi:YggT family protein